MITYLDEILEWHSRRAAADHRSLDQLITRALDCPPTRGYRSALADRAAAPIVDAATSGRLVVNAGSAVLTAVTAIETISRFT